MDKNKELEDLKIEIEELEEKAAPWWLSGFMDWGPF